MKQSGIISIAGKIILPVLIQWWIISTLGWTLTLSLLMLGAVGLIIGYKYDYIPKNKYHSLINRGIKGFKVAKILAQKYFEEDPPVTFQINNSRKSASITYPYNGKVYLINVPYVPNMSTKMTLNRAYLVRNGREIEITQQPGIPYSVDATELGGDKIIFRDLSGELSGEFASDKIPKI